MKRVIFITITCILITNCLYAQLGHQRGVYINRLVDIDNAGNIVPANTILGNVVKEDEILKYCMENHFTYITLYGLSRLFDTNGNFKQGWDVKLNDFICKAKSTYCIEYVGGVIVDNESDVPSALRITGPISFTNAFKQDTVLYPLLQYLEDTIPTDDERFTISRAVFRLVCYNKSFPSYSIKSPVINFLISTTEFFNREVQSQHSL